MSDELDMERLLPGPPLVVRRLPVDGDISRNRGRVFCASRAMVEARVLRWARKGGDG